MKSLKEVGQMVRDVWKFKSLNSLSKLSMPSSKTYILKGIKISPADVERKKIS